MATGYDQRETRRASFAFAPVQARQTQNSAAVVPTGRSGVVGGGEARGGVVMSSAPSIGMGAGSGIPEFLEAVFEPVIQQRSAERMYQGYADAIDGATMDEIAEAKPALAGLFGQSDFEKGASFYHAQNGLANWQSEQLANMDQLKRMDPSQVGKVLFDAAKPYLTGDATTDNSIHRMVIEASNELLPQVSAARIEWRNEEQRNGMTQLGVTRAGNLRALREQALSTGTPLPPEASFAFLESMRPIEGMSDDNWAAAVEQVARSVQADGNIAAYNAMAEGGTNSLLYMALGARGDGAKYQAIVSRAEIMGKDANTDFAARPEVAARIDLMWARSITGELRGTALREEMLSINEAANLYTGSEVPLFDEETITAGVKTSVRDVVAEDRANAREERAWERSGDNPANVAAKAEAESADIRNLIAKGQVGEAEGRYTKDKVSGVMRSWYLSDRVGSVKELVRTHQQQGATFPDLARDIQSQVSANLTAGATSEAFQVAVKQWQEFGTGDGTVARAFYYGDYDDLFDRYQQLVGRNGGDPLFAYNQTFGQPGAIQGTQGRRPRAEGETGEAIATAIRRMGPRLMGFVNKDGYSAASQENVLDVISGRVGERLRNNPNYANNMEGLIAAEVNVAMGSKLLDRVGKNVWHTPMRGSSLEEAVGFGSDVLAPIWEAEVKETFEQTYGESSDDYEVMVGQDGNGKPMWSAHYAGSDGTTRVVRITPEQLQDRRRSEAARVRAPREAAAVSNQRAEAFSRWITEPGLTFGERNRRVNDRAAFVERNEYPGEVTRLMQARDAERTNNSAEGRRDPETNVSRALSGRAQFLRNFGN